MKFPGYYFNALATVGTDFLRLKRNLKRKRFERMAKADLISKPQPDGQATYTVKPQEKITEDISQSSRMTMCFRMPIMIAKTNSNQRHEQQYFY